MQTFRRFIAFIIGVVFLVSGYTKLIDPVGASLVVKEYFEWMHMSFMAPTASFLGTALALLEAVLGLGLVMGVFRRFMAIATMTIMAFFTIISIALVISNPVMDCGCFGEFVHLSHSQTLIKNIILCAMSALAFFPIRNLGEARRRKYPLFFLNLTALLIVLCYSLISLPYFDFTEYKISNTLVTEIEENTDGVALFAIRDSFGEDMSSVILEGNVALISIYDAEDLDAEDFNELAMFASDAANEGYIPYVVSTTLVDVPGVECFLGDYKSIITLNRSNGGATLLEDGYIADKCAFNFLFESEELAEILEEGAPAHFVHRSTERAIFFQMSLLVFVILAIV